MEKEIMIRDVLSEEGIVSISIAAVVDEDENLIYYSGRINGREIVQVKKNAAGEWCHIGRPPDVLSKAVGKAIDEGMGAG